MSARSLLVIVLCLHVSTVRAATYYVGSATECVTIQAAIDVAQDGDTVVIPPGTYAENIQFTGKAITVTSTNPHNWEVVCHTIIDGQAREGSDGSCVAFLDGETSASILEGVTLTNGNGTPMADPYAPHLSGHPAGFGGGGIYCRDSAPTIRYCRITGNGEGSWFNADTTYGGGIALDGACGATISHCLIVDNVARSYGAGIVIANNANGPAAAIRQCTIANNEVTRSRSATGGYEVDCGQAGPIVTHTIIYGSLAEGLRIGDIDQVTYSCLKSVYVSQGDGPEDVAPAEFAGVGGNIGASPLLTGGTDPTGYHLGGASPCLNAGDPNYAREDELDIDGEPRMMGGRIDIGADEVVPSLAVLRPQGGAVLAAGSTHEVTWSGYAGSVDVRFSADGGVTWETLATSVTGDSYWWQLPESVESGACVVSVVPSVSEPMVTLTDSGAFTIQPDTVGPPVTAQWATLGGDFARRGTSNHNGLTEGGAAWTREIGGAAIGSVTVGFDGRIHAACEDGKLYTFDAGGQALWIADVNTPLLSTPSIGPDGSLFVGGADGRLRAIAPDGTLRWTFETTDAVYAAPAVAPDGAVYCGSADGTLYALGADGSELWRFQTKGPGRVATGAIFASPSLGVDGTVYAGGLYDPNLYALNPADGTIQWICNFALYPEHESDPNSAKTGGWPFAAAVVGQDGTIYQTLLYDPRLYAIDPSDGTLLWATDLLAHPAIDPEDEQFDPDADGWSEPVLAPDGAIYVSLDDPYLRAVDPDGTIRWVTKLGEVGAFTLTTDKNGWVYAACDDGYVYVVDAEGLQIGRWETAGWPGYPVLAADGTLLITDSKDYSMLITDLKNAVRALSIDTLQDPQ